MRPSIRAFVELAARSFDLRGPVYEFGSYLVEGQRELADLRPLFPGREYVGCDMRRGPGVDCVEDLAELSLADESAGTVLCLDTLEHVFEVRRAADELLRVLRPGGTIIVSAPLDFRIHAFPDDYWRITPSCLARLLGPLDALVVGSQGVESHPHTVLALGMKAPVAADFLPRASRLLSLFQDWLDEQRRARPFGKRIKHWLRGLTASKGERREASQQFAARFVTHCTARVEQRQQELAAW